MLLIFDKLKNRNRNECKLKWSKKNSKVKSIFYQFKTVFSSKKIANKNFTFSGLNWDANKLKSQESKLEISDEHCRFVLEASGAGVWDWDMRTNNVFYSSRSIKILELKLNNSSYHSERWDDNIHPDDLEKYYAAIQKHFDQEVPFYENRYRILIPNGGYKWILERGKVTERDVYGRPLKIIGTHIDISLQKEKEFELSSKVELYRKQKNRLLNFSHIVSHNLNSHIGNIKLLLDINNLKENKSNIETLMNLRTVSNDLNDTVSDLSEIVKIQNNSGIIVKPLEINVFLNKVLSIISGYNHEKKVKIINNIPDETKVRFNPAYLESVLLNLCTNAIKYAHPNRFPVIKFDFFIENEKKTLTIADNGLGIDLEKYGSLIFGMYKTFHKHKNANGIGLYIVKNQIEAMKGQVSVTSKVGEGTVFKIKFND